MPGFSSRGSADVSWNSDGFLITSRTFITLSTHATAIGSSRQCRLLGLFWRCQEIQAPAVLMLSGQRIALGMRGREQAGGYGRLFRCRQDSALRCGLGLGQPVFAVGLSGGSVARASGRIRQMAAHRGQWSMSRRWRKPVA